MDALFPTSITLVPENCATTDPLKDEEEKLTNVVVHILKSLSSDSKVSAGDTHR